MITAIPMKSDRISGHFTKAPEMILLDGSGHMLERFANPALESGCSGKEKLLEILAEKKVERVVVRHIGEQMLGKLLQSNMLVFQTNGPRFVNEALSRPEAFGMLPLTKAEQGRESVNHTKKMAEGGCCGHEHHHDHEHQNDASDEPRGHCCQGKGESQAPAHGKHRCCQH
ncbi:NifB/NifX family molybdenum-iron cluster-binding protein [Reinekea marinisedimentorum]|uniref:Putative Fe-Mo cluster-binding NifX family protein n=1 Tax=Reinekea marinisedimentorum TaxID=230495 RepID=A0A4R3I316_9GAMM|nr:NifB/NifX family molybdenum-iron cluster-binding protein [Reinekea marinisedimentorum]TCS39972.1 putative Fe-Mo cluster-binding NifX family protein [Reinekea marinisedimentorum]